MTLESKFYPGQQVYLPVRIIETKILERGQILYKIKCCVNDWEDCWYTPEQLCELGEMYENKI